MTNQSESGMQCNTHFQHGRAEAQCRRYDSGRGQSDQKEIRQDRTGQEEEEKERGKKQETENQDDNFKTKLFDMEYQKI